MLGDKALTSDLGPAVAVLQVQSKERATERRGGVSRLSTPQQISGDLHWPCQLQILFDPKTVSASFLPEHSPLAGC